MLDMQVIEALFIRVEEPHDYLDIKQFRSFLARVPGRGSDEKIRNVEVDRQRV
jgi:hypothetical protein